MTFQNNEFGHFLGSRRVSRPRRRGYTGSDIHVGGNRKRAHTQGTLDGSVTHRGDGVNRGDGLRRSGVEKKCREKVNVMY